MEEAVEEEGVIGFPHIPAYFPAFPMKRHGGRHPADARPAPDAASRLRLPFSYANSFINLFFLFFFPLYEYMNIFINIFVCVLLGFVWLFFSFLFNSQIQFCFSFFGCFHCVVASIVCCN